MIRLKKHPEQNIYALYHVNDNLTELLSFGKWLGLNFKEIILDKRPYFKIDAQQADKALWFGAVLDEQKNLIEA